MTPTRARFITLCAVFGIFPAIPLPGQDTQPPLGDIVRQQQAEREHKPKAKRVIGTEDIRGSHSHEIWGDAAVTVIIPNIRISGVVPDGVSYYPPPDSKQKLHVWFGPGTLDQCQDLDCGEETYFSTLPRTIGGRVNVLFKSDDSIDGNSARIAHFEIAHDVRGKIVGTVAMIQTPFAVAAATCHYLETDAQDAESDCEAFIRSLRVHVPERYIYVHHNS